MSNYPEKQLVIDVSLVHSLVTAQFPQWQGLPISLITPGGWDHRTLHLGSQMIVRLPSSAIYQGQIAKEFQWLPLLMPLLPLKIPMLLEIGKPTKDYPWQWGIYRYIPGEVATAAPINNLCDFAADLARFLTALQRIDVINGPLPGTHNFYRGGVLSIYDNEVQQALMILKNKLDIQAVNKIWQAALATTWYKLPVWVHGDMAASNLLVQEGRLSAVLDFGLLAIGDPACDLAIAWTFFKGESREIFRKTLAFNTDTMDERSWLGIMESLNCCSRNDKYSYNNRCSSVANHR